MSANTLQGEIRAAIVSWQKATGSTSLIDADVDELAIMVTAAVIADKTGVNFEDAAAAADRLIVAARRIQSPDPELGGGLTKAQRANELRELAGHYREFYRECLTVTANRGRLDLQMMIREQFEGGGLTRPTIAKFFGGIRDGNGRGHDGRSRWDVERYFVEPVKRQIDALAACGDFSLIDLQLTPPPADADQGIA